VDWSGATATIEVTTGDGETPPVDDLQKAIAQIVPAFVGVVVDVGQGVEIPVQ
jgi:hypothetical protein